MVAVQIQHLQEDYSITGVTQGQSATIYLYSYQGRDVVVCVVELVGNTRPVDCCMSFILTTVELDWQVIWGYNLSLSEYPVWSLLSEGAKETPLPHTNCIPTRESNDTYNVVRYWLGGTQNSCNELPSEVVQEEIGKFAIVKYIPTLVDVIQKLLCNIQKNLMPIVFMNDVVH